MSEQKQIGKLKERKILPNELKYIEAMSDLLANESGMDKDWIKNVLLLTIPRSLLPTHSEDYKKYPVRLLHQFRPCLFEAMKWMSREMVRELFSGDLSHLRKSTTEFEVCPSCAVRSYSVHDRRVVKVQDTPIRGSGVYLEIVKRRFRCPSCKKVFTEPVSGIQKGFKTTHRYRRGLKWACENFVDLKRVQRAFGCSAGLVYKVFYEQLERKLRERSNNPWPSTIGIDEHCFRRGFRRREFATILVDYPNKKIFEVGMGKTADGLSANLRSRHRTRKR